MSTVFGTSTNFGLEGVLMVPKQLTLVLLFLLHHQGPLQTFLKSILDPLSTPGINLRLKQLDLTLLNICINLLTLDLGLLVQGRKVIILIFVNRGVLGNQITAA